MKQATFLVHFDALRDLLGLPPHAELVAADADNGSREVRLIVHGVGNEMPAGVAPAAQRIRRFWIGCDRLLLDGEDGT